MSRFGKVLTAMVTPFTSSGDLDLDEAGRLAQWLIQNGNDGLVIAGTTGESPTLTHDEQIALIEAVVNSVDAPVIAGTGSNDTKAAIELTQRAQTVGASGILSVTPITTDPHSRAYFNISRESPNALTFRLCCTTFLSEAEEKSILKRSLN